MTRKNALEQAIDIVKSSAMEEDVKKEVIEKLALCISELPFAKWSKDAIFDACDQFVEEHNRPLLLNDFQSSQLPSHPTVKNRFGITLKEFRDTYYPLPSVSTTRYGAPAELVREFRREFLRCGARTRMEYDRLRSRELPCSATVIKNTGARSWGDLLHMAEIQIKRKRGDQARYTASFSMACTREKGD